MAGEFVGAGNDDIFSIDFVYNLNPSVDAVEAAKDRDCTPRNVNKKRTRSGKNSLERAHFYELTDKSSSDYRKIDVMYRLYRICDNLKVSNNEKIYSMFLMRLKRRMRLESSTNKLELTVAALHYIDRLGTDTNLRDVLCKISDLNVPLKSFVRHVAKLCQEIGVKRLPQESYATLVSTCLDQLRQYFARNLNDSATETPTCKMIVLSNFVEFLELENLIKRSADLEKGSLDDSPHGLHEGGSIDDTDQSSRNKLDDNAKKLIHRSICVKYEFLQESALKLLKLLNSGNHSNLCDDILDSKCRSVFFCRKTFISSILYIVFLAFEIPVTPPLIIASLKAVRSSFYRNIQKILQELEYILPKKLNVRIHTRRQLYPLLSSFLTGGNKLYLPRDPPNNGEKTRTFEKDKSSRIHGVNDELLTKHIVRVAKAVERIDNHTCMKSSHDKDKVNFEQALNCLEILDSPPTEDSRKATLIDEKSGNRYICRWRDSQGKLKRKCFSKRYYGPETALKLANKFCNSLRL